MWGLAPCGAAIAQTGGRRSWDHETGKAVDGRRWKQKETGKCLKSYQRDPAVFSSLPLSLGSLALGLRVLLSRESMEGVQSFTLLLSWSGRHTHRANSAFKETIFSFSRQRVCWRKPVSLNSLGFLSINSSVGRMLERGHRQWSRPRKSIYSRLSSAKESFCSGKSTSPCTKLYGGG